MKICYIAGKISGLPEEEWQANFREAKALVEEFGFVALSPVDLPHDHERTWLLCMREDLTALLTCDALYAQRNWHDSKGATIEVNLALALGIPVIDQFALDIAEQASSTPATARAYLASRGLGAFIGRGLELIRQQSVNDSNSPV